MLVEERLRIGASLRDRIEQQRLGLGFVLARLAFAAGGHVLSECGDLDRFHAKADVRKAEAPADDPAVPEELLDLVGMRRGADVEVLGPPAEEQIAYAAADQIRNGA
jgi:hypothetical protein